MIFLKLGGSLITDKARPETARLDVLARLAAEIADARRSDPSLRLLIGHGSGSFGHAAAARHRTHEGAHTAEDWAGFAEVWRSANRLNRLVVDSLVAAGLPVISLPPSASALAEDGVAAVLADEPIRRSLEHGLLPVVQGDVAFDTRRGASILSTEAVFSRLVPLLKPRAVLLAGADPGVFSDFPANTALLTEVDQGILEDRRLGASAAVDVTGGMAEKVRAALAWVRHQPGLDVRIFSAESPGQLRQALLGGTPGTRVAWSDRPG